MTVHTKQSSELPDAVVVVGVCDTSSTATSSAAAAAATNHQRKRKTKKELPAVIEIEDEHELEQKDHSSSSSSGSDILLACSRSPLSMDHLDDGDDDGDHRPPSLSSLSFISSSSRSLSLSTCCSSSSSSLLSSAFYSGTNSSSSGSRSTVSFEDNVSVQEIPNALYDYTKKEVQASWYTRSELAKQRRTSRNLAETMDFYSDEELFDRFGVQSVQKFMDRAHRNETSKNLFFHLEYDKDDDDEEEEGEDDYDSRIAAASQYARDFTSISLESSRTAQKDAERIASQLYGGGN
mmetsp:Transcript_38855/g.94061  ORF Transcript_38855/g.94061 Transcript_38855/m.94061 type:complete len:293 (-) Transcript_38855:1392-2270(-)|eukprot:CAMPEP_0113463796 /NCGR_PEP_ID=MMETSP0014_2-20120614/12854_1 /TAXON_ID=2857 /ORGANISM="Nitzschia sp." /LENGTH=292 /DNA_ID=CAMNT_0000355825 /DNA_START=114 /DNA_END=992 /DNA_ORIENTATION=- /assembly_acc=CAM_ASM_000159